MKVHEIKTWPEFFQDIKSGIKTFEYRKDDRLYNYGDYLILKEYMPDTDFFTGEELMVKVIYLLRGPKLGIPAGYVIMGIKQVA